MRCRIVVLFLVGSLLVSCDGLGRADVPDELVGRWVYDYGPGTMYFVIDNEELISGETSDYPDVPTYSFSEAILDVYLEKSMFYTDDDRYFVWHVEGTTMHCLWEWIEEPAITDNWWVDGRTFIKQ